MPTTCPATATRPPRPARRAPARAAAGRRSAPRAADRRRRPHHRRGRARPRPRNERASRRHACRAASRRPARPIPTTTAACGSKRCRACGRRSPATWSQSYTTIPQLTNFDDADVTELEDMREQSKDDYADRGIKLTDDAVSDQGGRLVAQAAPDAQRLGRHGRATRSSTRSTSTSASRSTPSAAWSCRCCATPTARASRKSPPSWTSWPTTVREGKFDLDLLKGGTFTISNLGAVGGTYSTPIINPPQVAILLVGRTPHRAADRRRRRRRRG